MQNNLFVYSFYSDSCFHQHPTTKFGNCKDKRGGRELPRVIVPCYCILLWNSHTVQFNSYQIVLYNQRKSDAKVNTKNLTHTHTHYMKIRKFR